MNRALISAMIVVNFLSVISGYCIAVVHRAVPYLKNEFKMPDSMQSWAFNALLLGSFLGAVLLTRPADFRGRRRVLSMLALLFIFSIVATGVTSDFFLFCLFRFLTGLAVGAASVLVPVYLSELAPAHVRGKVVLSFPLALVTGMILAFLADYWLQDTGASNWRYMILAGAFPALLFFLFRVFLPESPRFLMQKGLEQETDLVIGHIDPDADRFTFREGYKKNVNHRALRKNSSLFKPYSVKPILLCIMTGIFAAFSGINTVTYFAAEIATKEGMTMQSVSWPGLIIGLLSLAILILLMRQVDKMGRKKLMQAGTLGLSICLILLSVIVFTGTGILAIPSVVLILFFTFFAISAGTLPWVIFPEVLHNTARIRGVAAGVGAFWLFSLLTSILVPILSGGQANAISFSIYGIMMFLGYLFFRNNLSETKKTVLEEIDSGMRHQHE